MHSALCNVNLVSANNVKVKGVALTSDVRAMRCYCWGWVSTQIFSQRMGLEVVAKVL